MGPVLCCLDDSDGARSALSVAKELATRLGLELVLVHAEPPLARAPGLSIVPGGHDRLLAAELSDGEGLLERLSQEAGLAGLRVRATAGPAASSIVAICEEEEAGLVVLGSRGRGGLASAMLGSVSSEVAARAPCPCVIVPPGSAGISPSA